jgi:hypothetical protein
LSRQYLFAEFQYEGNLYASMPPVGHGLLQCQGIGVIASVSDVMAELLWRLASMSAVASLGIA